MTYLIDTGILLRVFEESDPQCALIQEAIAALQDRNEELCTTSQNIAEFWNVSTRPEAARGGFGKSPEIAMDRVAMIQSMCRLLTESHQSFDAWKQIVISLGMQGVSVHDARIAAVMRVNNLTHILTFDINGFARFPGITPQSPGDVVNS